jgi:hypothetical protein
MAKFMSNGVCLPLFPSSPRNGTKSFVEIHIPSCVLSAQW